MTAVRATYPAYYASKNKIALSPAIDVDKVLREIKDRYAGEQVNDIDGVKIDFAENWVHLRKSNTEPIIRIYTEARSMAEADALAQRFQHVPFHQQLADGGAFAAGENDTVDTGQISFFSYFDTGDTELFQHMFMLDESTLYGKYADGHFYLPRSSIMI